MSQYYRSQYYRGYDVSEDDDDSIRVFPYNEKDVRENFTTDLTKPNTIAITLLIAIIVILFLLFQNNIY